MYGRGYQGGVGFGPGFTPPIIKQLIIANVVVVLLQQLLQSVSMIHLFGVTPYGFWREAFVWQPFTYMFLHGDLMHIAVNMFTLWMFGSSVAALWGPRRFLRFYLTCGVGAGIIIATVPYLLRAVGVPASVTIPTIGASGAVFGVLLASAVLWPDRTVVLLFPPIPLKAIYLIPVIFLIEFFFGAPGISHTGHLGGVVVGWLLLQREGLTGDLPIPTLRSLRYRWHRYRMRRRLRAVRREEWESRRRNDRRVH